MTWSWKVGQPSGIDLRIHVTFLLFLSWVGASYWLAGKSLSAMLAGASFAAALPQARRTAIPSAETSEACRDVMCGTARRSACLPRGSRTAYERRL